ncbi:DUF2892 domain-containing protein [bacterium]|nr:DUF2892 domain-containing protein [bacterium]
MTIERMLRMIGGGMVLLSLILAIQVNIHWLYLTAFVGLNLFQSAFTNWCPMVYLLEKLGFQRCQPA